MELSSWVKWLEKECFREPWGEVPTSEPFTQYLLISRGFPLGYLIAMVVPPQGEVLRIGVLKRYRGRGYGRILMENFLRDARRCGVKKVFLEVRVSNMGAIKFYEKMGFRVVGLRRALYSNGEDGFVMAREV